MYSTTAVHSTTNFLFIRIYVALRLASLPPELFQAGGDSELRAGPAGDEGGGAASGAGSARGGGVGGQGVAASTAAHSGGACVCVQLYLAAAEADHGGYV